MQHDVMLWLVQLQHLSLLPLFEPCSIRAIWTREKSSFSVSIFPHNGMKKLKMTVRNHTLLSCNLFKPSNKSDTCSMTWALAFVAVYSSQRSGSSVHRASCRPPPPPFPPPVRHRNSSLTLQVYCQQTVTTVLGTIVIRAYWSRFYERGWDGWESSMVHDNTGRINGFLTIRTSCKYNTDM